MYEAWRKKDAVGYLTKLIHTKRKKSVGHFGVFFCSGIAWGKADDGVCSWGGDQQDKIPQNIAPRGWIEILAEVAANQIETTGKKETAKWNKISHQRSA